MCLRVCRQLSKAPSLPLIPKKGLPVKYIKELMSYINVTNKPCIPPKRDTKPNRQSLRVVEGSSNTHRRSREDA